MKDNYLASAITLEVQNHYQFHPENVNTILFTILCNTDETNNCQLYESVFQMYATTHVTKSKTLATAIQFFYCNILARCPSNVFIIINIHSDKFSGMLQYTGGHTGDTNTTIKEIIQAYLEDEFVVEMKALANTARNLKISY